MFEVFVVVSSNQNEIKQLKKIFYTVMHYITINVVVVLHASDITDFIYNKINTNIVLELK